MAALCEPSQGQARQCELVASETKLGQLCRRHELTAKRSACRESLKTS